MTPLVLQMLLDCGRGQGLPSPLPSPVHEEAWAKLLDDGIINRESKLTARGEAWLAMILDTPMPVQQWIDPRRAMDRLTKETYATFIQDASDDGLTPRQRAQRERRMREKAPVVDYSDQLTTLNMQPPPASAPTIPPGFTAWDGSAATPPGLKPDQPVEVMRRNGKIVSKVGGDQLYAVSVNWRNNGKPDDTIAYRLTTDPLDMEE